MKLQLLSCEEILISSRRCYYIKSIDSEKLRGYMSQISECKISNDFDKYFEKAKLVAIDCMKETNMNYDEDDIIANNHLDLERDNYFSEQSNQSKLRYF